MAAWNDYEPGSELTDEQKLDFLGQLCAPHVPNEQKLAFLEVLAESGWKGIVDLKQDFLRKLGAADSDYERIADLDKLAASGWLASMLSMFQLFSKFPVDCQMPHNTHTVHARKAYRCQGPDAHVFCQHHQLDKCPLDDMDVDAIP